MQSGTRYERFDIGKAVPSVTSDLAALWRVDSDVSASPANRSTAADDVRAHIGKVKTNATPRELMTASNETTVTVKATAHSTVDAAPVMVTSSTTVGIATYADAPDGWLAGDGHVHSEYSDGSGTVAEDAAAAAATGLDFMVITDHADKMTARDFGTELSECDAATYETGVRTIMGQEYPINHVFLSADGHYLGYSPNYYIDPTGITHQSIIDAVNAAGGIGIIAHPNHYTMGWSNWGVSGYAGLEILSDGWLSDSDAGLRERWDGLIADRTGCAGMGSSDAHSAVDIGQERTYVYTGGSTSKTAILAGIRNGQTVVSDGIFASCDINGRGIGEHVRASFGESLPVRVDWPTGQNLSTVTLVYNGRTVREHVHADDNAASELVIPVTATDGGAIRIEATGTNGKHAYTSPVFVDVGVAGGVIDLVFVVDTTGSMWDDIAAAKQAATQIAASLEGVDARVAVVDYRDFPQWPYGTSWDYPYHDVLDFTSDQAAIATGIRSLYLGNGLDWQESVYSALIHTIDGTSLGGWRQQPNKYIILIGDAPPHDPEPFTGCEMQNVLDAAYAADPITIYPIVVGGESTTVWYFNGLAEGSGGRTFTANNAGELVDAILAAIGDIIETPAVSAELRVEPRTLNLESEGQGISAHLSFPDELPAGGITVTELKVNGVVLPVTGDAPLVDGDSNGVADVRVTFDRAALEAILDPGEQTLLVTGKVNGQLFSASDIIKVTDPVHDTGGNLRN